MTFAIASDHQGFKQKQKITKYLTKKGHKVIDFGPPTDEPVDFPPFAFQVCENVIEKKVNLGIMICGSAVGANIACNKVKGIRAAKLNSLFEAKFAKRDDNANVLNFSKKTLFPNLLIKRFIKTKFSDEPRYQRRLDMISKYEETNEY